MGNDLFDLYAAAFGKVRQNAVNYMIGVTMRKAQSKVAKTFGMTKRQTAQTLGEARRKRTEAIRQKIMENGLVSYRPKPHNHRHYTLFPPATTMAFPPGIEPRSEA